MSGSKTLRAVHSFGTNESRMTDATSSDRTSAKLDENYFDGSTVIAQHEKSKGGIFQLFTHCS